jgi:recombination protein RecR
MISVIFVPILCVSRARSVLVESIRDIIAIENTNTYRGTYHVLGGVISPIDGVGPDQLHIPSLIESRCKKGMIRRVIMALSPTIEGDTTIFYISKKLKDFDVQIDQHRSGYILRR